MADIALLAQWLAGHFNNKAQALRDPVWFANIHVYQCPLPWSVFKGWGFYVEQAYDITLERPYRQRVLHLTTEPERIVIQNYELVEPQRWLGAGRNLALLQTMTFGDCHVLSGCLTEVRWNGLHFQGTSIPGKTCRVVRKDQETYLYSEFRVGNGEFFSLDQGRDPLTDKVIWGSLSGSFEFQKVADFAAYVPTPTLN